MNKNKFKQNSSLTYQQDRPGMAKPENKRYKKNVQGRSRPVKQVK
jgi:hypothetical protein